MRTIGPKGRGARGTDGRRQRRGLEILLVLTALAIAGVAAEAGELPPAATGADAYRHVVTYGSMPDLHRTGTPGGHATADWIAGELASYGLAPVKEAFAFPRFAVRSASLSVGDFEPAVLPFYYSGLTGPGGVTAPLADVGLGTPLDFARTDVAGRIALVDVPAAQNAFVPTLDRALASARDGGAVAVVASIRAALNHTAGQNVDSRGGLCDLPTLIVGKLDGDELRRRDGMTATLVLDGEHQDGEEGRPIGTTANVVAMIPGAGDDVIIVGTPYNGWFAAASERGSGLGVFLTLARHFAGTYAATPPPQTLVFVATGGHEVGFLGLPRFLSDHPDLVGRTTAYVHLGATIAAREYAEIGGEAVETGTPAALRVLFTSENPLLLAIAETAMRTRPTAPVESVPPSVQNPGEQQFMYRAGVPMVSMSGGNFFFHTAGDLPHTTSAALLDPMVDAWRAILEELLALDRDTVREANVVAERFAGDSGDTGEAVRECR